MPDPANVTSHPFSDEHGNARVLRVPKTAEIIARLLRKEMLRAGMKPGDPLPSEAALRERFKVSRPTIREAIRILETQHLVKVARGAGGGARFAMPSAAMVADFTAVFLQARRTTQRELHETRLVIEPHIIGSMAGRLSPEGIRLLRGSAVRHAALVDDVAAFGREHENFYALLAQVCPNTMMALLLVILRDLIHAQTDLLSHDFAVRTGDPARGLEAHARLLGDVVDRLEAGDQPESEALWRRVLEALYRRLLALGLGDRLIEAL